MCGSCFGRCSLAFFISRSYSKPASSTSSPSHRPKSHQDQFIGVSTTHTHFITLSKTICGLLRQKTTSISRNRIYYNTTFNMVISRISTSKAFSHITCRYIKPDDVLSSKAHRRATVKMFEMNPKLSGNSSNRLSKWSHEHPYLFLRHCSLKTSSISGFLHGKKYKPICP